MSCIPLNSEAVLPPGIVERHGADDAERSILAITRFGPGTGVKYFGYQIRQREFYPHLVEQGYHIDVLQITSDRDENRKLLEQIAQQYDLVWMYRTAFWPQELKILKQLGRFIIFDIDDPIGLSASNWGNISPSRWIRFAATARASDIVTVASKGLAEEAGWLSARTELVPMLTGTSDDQPSNLPTERAEGEPLRLLWSGSRSTLKYLEKVRPQLTAIGKEFSDVELTIIGDAPFELSSMKTSFHHYDKEVVRRELSRSHVGIVPLQHDRWCQGKATYKPLLYLANGLPFVGTPVGVVREYAHAGGCGLLVNSTEEWVNAIRRLRNYDNLRIELAERGLDYVKKHHSLNTISMRVADIFDSLLAGQQASRAA
ncbi:glycosyltransferase [Calycomorphotria hydatis]|uniref:Glycosyl transferases group 1 n=1 Tax=Calycomorphotria hydatis TaxID=2528027 RepID=A0A517T6J4_9PLAN|nr:glycosyltransferase [Calycomorphotria hydatis]QDT63981.1 hypothetical protein V22_12110 [Calycomorphotria hydatis]